MNIRNPRLWIAGISAAAVVFLVLGDIGRKSPGPLTTVHARVPELAEDCSQCHGGWFTSMPEACFGCHDDIEAQIPEGEGLHGALDTEKSMRCALCHSEHHGPQFAIVNDQSFAQAGIPDPQEFDHEFVGFPMWGQHLELECNVCHVNSNEPLLSHGEKRYLGLEQDCGTCHEDAHDGRYALACAKCHGQDSFDQLDSAGHDALVPLIGGHGDMSCRECHARGSTYSLESLARARTPAPRECADCHESPHSADFIDDIAQLTSSTTASSCRACHEGEHTSFTDRNLTVTPAQHVCSGFPLDVPHENVDCNSCHSTTATTFAIAYPGRTADDCRQCHEDPHGGQFDRGTFSEGGCIACHDRERFEPHAFTVEKHALSRLPLTGSHLEATCNDCHRVPVGGGERVFHGMSSDCDSCHKDAHRGFFDRFERGLDWVTNGKCAHCHLSTTFSEVPADEFDHGEWTQFPILGAHAQVDCESCHPRNDAPDEFGRTFGVVADHFGPMKKGGEGCVTCHADPHQGEFNKPRLSRTFDGRTGCMRCHTHTSFRALPDGFAHLRWTGFSLDGAHGEASCSSCHKPLRGGDEVGRTWGRAVGTECSKCHTDPHAGQFQDRGQTDCRRCHQTAESFSKLSFRHNLDSRFHLGESHEGLACSACHQRVNQGGVEIVRYKPLGTACADCHGTREDAIRRRRERKR